MRKTLITAVGLLAIVGTANANPRSAENNLLNVNPNSNGNVTRIDGNPAGIDVRGISNPGQTRVQLRNVPLLNQVQVRVKNGDLTHVGALTDVQLNDRSNRNLTKVDGSIGNIDVRGISTPGVTKVTVTPPK